MKKFLGVILVLVCFITPAFAEPVSQEVLNQARTQAGLFMDLKNALGLEWLDEYNVYLTDPTGNPAPSWASSVDELINKNYLSVAFPTDFTIAPTGQEVTISRTITNQGVKNALPIYLPAVTISGDTVSLLVQRPAQWVAWEDALASKVSRAGDDNPDILPGASLEFGSGSKIEFINNDGKLVGINSLTYKGQELEDRFVNAAGDNMTGPLTIEGNKVWHAGNDGTGSGLDADLLDGEHGSYYLAAENLTGIVPPERLKGTYDIDILRNAATATKLATARTISLTGNASGSASFDGSSNISINTNVSYSSNSDKLDGYHADSFIKKSGDTATGPIYFQGGLSAEAQSKDDITTRTQSGFWQTNSATTGEGWPQTTNTWYHLLSSTHSNTGNYYAMQFAGNFFNSNDIYYRSTAGSGTTPWNKIWHAGNDGSGSGLDADMVDGKHWSDISDIIDNKHDPDNKIYFIAYNSPNQYVSWDAKINFTSEKDPFNCFDLSSDRFTAPREGLYFFAGRLFKLDGKAVSTGVRFRVNGKTLLEGDFWTDVGATGWEESTSTTIVIKLKAGDYVEMWGYAENWYVTRGMFYGIEL